MWAPREKLVGFFFSLFPPPPLRLKSGFLSPFPIAKATPGVLMMEKKTRSVLGLLHTHTRPRTHRHPHTFPFHFGPFFVAHPSPSMPPPTSSHRPAGLSASRVGNHHPPSPLILFFGGLGGVGTSRTAPTVLRAMPHPTPSPPITRRSPFQK